MTDDRSNEPLNDPLPGLIAGLDQMLSMAGEMARVTRGFYEAFLAEGFSHKEAMWLAITYLRPSDPPSEDE